MTDVELTLVELEPCVAKSTYTLIYEPSYPPTTKEAFQKHCEVKYEAFKCVKELLKKGKYLPLIKRGITGYVQARARFTKKYCTNIESKETQALINDFKCIIENREKEYRQLDLDVVKEMSELRQASGLGDKELKYICCSIMKYRRSLTSSLGPQCAASKTRIEELATSIVPDNINIICDDDEKHLEECNRLPVLEKLEGKPKYSAIVIILYLVATFGDRV